MLVLNGSLATSSRVKATAFACAETAGRKQPISCGPLLARPRIREPRKALIDANRCSQDRQTHATDRQCGRPKAEAAAARHRRVRCPAQRSKASYDRLGGERTGGGWTSKRSRTGSSEATGDTGCLAASRRGAQRPPVPLQAGARRRPGTAGGAFRLEFPLGVGMLRPHRTRAWTKAGAPAVPPGQRRAITALPMRCSVALGPAVRSATPPRPGGGCRRRTEWPSVRRGDPAAMARG